MMDWNDEDWAKWAEDVLAPKPTSYNSRAFWLTLKQVSIATIGSLMIGIPLALSVTALLVAALYTPKKAAPEYVAEQGQQVRWLLPAYTANTIHIADGVVKVMSLAGIDHIYLYASNEIAAAVLPKSTNGQVIRVKRADSGQQSTKAMVAPVEIDGGGILYLEPYDSITLVGLHGAWYIL